MTRRKPRVGFITYDLQPFTEDCLYRIAQRGEPYFEIKAYPIIHHKNQTRVRFPFRPSHAKGRFLGIHAAGVTPEGFASNIDVRAALACTRECDVTVLFGLQGATAMVASLLSVVSRHPLVSVNQTLPVAHEARRIWWVRWLKSWVLSQCSYHVYQNPAAKEVLTQIYGIPESKLFSAPFEAGAGVFDELLEKAEARPSARSALGVGDDLVCLFVGNLHPFKGVRDLLDAASRLNSQRRWRFVFVGPEEPRNPEGATIKGYMAQAEELGIAGRVAFSGPVPLDILPRYYRAADVVALPTKKDCFPKVLVEGALAERALLTSDACGAVGSLVVNDDNGFVVPAGSVDALVDALRRLENDELRLRMGARSRDRALAWCDAEAEARGFCDAVCAALEVFPKPDASTPPCCG